MSTCNKFLVLALLALPVCAPVYAQETTLDTSSSVKIDIPSDSPVTLISSSMGESRATVRGGAVVLDLHMSLTLRNAGARRVRGVTLLITAQEFAPGGKGSVARPCIDVVPNEEFTLPVDLRLVRPVQQGTGPLVRVQLDGVLFDDLGFFGPNKLNSQRAMTFWEVEAQRDRAFFKQVLSAKGDAGLRQEMLASLGRPRLDVAVSRGGRATGDAGGSLTQTAERVAQFAFLKVPDAPVEALEGSAGIFGSEAHAPRIEVLNKSPKAVRYVEIGWAVKDKDGNEYLAGSVPGSPASMMLGAGQKTSLLPDTTLKFSKNGKPVEIQSMTGFVSQVEFADGKVWIPSREALKSSPLLRVLAPSPEEQRLTDLYIKKGLAALVADLKRY